MTVETMDGIERKAKAYREARDVLVERVSDLNTELERVKRSRLRGIRGAVRTARQLHAELLAAIDAARGLFDRPKTRILHGIKCGLQKGKGRVEFDDEAALLGRIERVYADNDDLREQLVNVKRSINKTALGNLSGAELKRLGVRVEDVGDRVLAKPADGEVDKIVDALLKDTDAESEDAE